MLTSSIQEIVRIESRAHPGCVRPFSCVTISCENGSRADIYFNDVESIIMLIEELEKAFDELQSEIDIAMEEADKAERRGMK